MPSGTVIAVSHGQRLWIQPADGGAQVVCEQANTRNSATPNYDATVTIADSHIGDTVTYERSGQPQIARRVELA